MSLIFLFSFFSSQNTFVINLKINDFMIFTYFETIMKSAKLLLYMRNMIFCWNISFFFLLRK